MSEVEMRLARIEAIMAEIEDLERATGGQYRQPSDQESRDILARMYRKKAAQELDRPQAEAAE